MCKTGWFSDTNEQVYSNLQLSAGLANVNLVMRTATSSGDHLRPSLAPANSRHATLFKSPSHSYRSTLSPSLVLSLTYAHLVSWNRSRFFFLALILELLASEWKPVHNMETASKEASILRQITKDKLNSTPCTRSCQNSHKHRQMTPSLPILRRPSDRWKLKAISTRPIVTRDTQDPKISSFLIPLRLVWFRLRNDKE